MATAIMFFISFVIGYYVFLLLSHPEKKHHKVPRLRFGNVQVLPNFKIHRKNSIYHIHHWFILTIVVAVGLFIYEGIRSPIASLFHGVAFGGILQGLRFKDRFKFRFPNSDSSLRQKNKKQP
jgi:hypothetical protein